MFVWREITEVVASMLIVALLSNVDICGMYEVIDCLQFQDNNPDGHKVLNPQNNRIFPELKHQSNLGRRR